MNPAELVAGNERVFIFPGLKRSLLLEAPEPAPFPLGRGQATFCFNARAALWQGLHRLGLQAGDRVLVPTYACGSEIDVLRAYGLTLDWYPLTPQLEPDVAYLRALVRADTAALFVIHYFGFAQPISKLASFAREHGLLLIEDAAHALFSAESSLRPLGSFGDLSVFSLYKTLALPDGGALVMNNLHNEHLSGNQVTPSLRHSVSTLRQLMQRTIEPRHPRMGKLIVTPLRPRSGRSQRDHAIATIDLPWKSVAPLSFQAARGDWGLSSISRWLIDRAARTSIVAQRRTNYQRLALQLEDGPRLRPLFEHLPDGTCPLMFPVLQLNGRSGLRPWLNRHNIECHGFGFENAAIPTNGFEWEAELKAQVVCLPVHQDLAPAQIDRIARIVNQWMRQPV